MKKILAVAMVAMIGLSGVYAQELLPSGDDGCVTVTVAYSAETPELQTLMGRDMARNNHQSFVIRGVPIDAITACNKDKNPAIVDILSIDNGSGDIEVVGRVQPGRTLLVRVPASDTEYFAYISRCFSPEQVGEYEGFFTPSGDQTVTLVESHFGAPTPGNCALA